MKHKRKLETELVTTQSGRKFRKISKSINCAKGGELKIRSEYQIMGKFQDELQPEGDGTNKYYSAYIDVEKCVSHILERIRTVVAQVENATMEDALEKFFSSCVLMEHAMRVFLVRQKLLSHFQLPLFQHG